MRQTFGPYRAECQKCGATGAMLGCQHNTRIDHGAEHLAWMCRRCSFHWATRTKDTDEGRQDN